MKCRIPDKDKMKILEKKDIETLFVKFDHAKQINESRSLVKQVEENVAKFRQK